MAALALENRSLQNLLSKRIEFVPARRPYGTPITPLRMPRDLLSEPTSSASDRTSTRPSASLQERLSTAATSPSSGTQSSSPARPTSKADAVKASKLSSGEQPAEPKKVLFGADQLSHTWSKDFKHPPPGLHNLGNTCFLNSAMQALMHVPSLVQYLLSQAHSEACRATNCMLCELEKHAIKAYPSRGQTRGKAYRPAIVAHLKQIGKKFRLGRQEDSHEFLILLMDAVQRSCLTGQPKTLDFASRQTTMVHRVFGGNLRQQIVCSKCKRPSNTYEPLLVLSLDVMSTLEQSFSRLTSRDMLQGRNRYKCEHCKSLQDARKQTSIHDAPQTLVVHFKRFQFSLHSSKVNKHVQYPAELNLTPFMSSGRPSPRYSLAAVVVHSGGGVNSGHYYAFGRAPDGAWYEYDDSTVTKVSVQQALRQQAYMLVYLADQEGSTGQRQPVSAASAPVTDSSPQPQQNMSRSTSAHDIPKLLKPGQSAVKASALRNTPRAAPINGHAMANGHANGVHKKRRHDDRDATNGSVRVGPPQKKRIHDGMRL